MAGNAVVYVDKSITRGSTEVGKGRPEPSILLNARESAKLVLTGTGILQQTIQVQVAGRTNLDYEDDLDLSSLTAALGASGTKTQDQKQGEGETGEAPIACG